MFKRFVAQMDLLSENFHAQKWAWIFICMVLGALVPGTILSLIVGPIGFLIVSSFIFVTMVANYGRLWSLTGPSLTATRRQLVESCEALELAPIRVQDVSQRTRW